MFQLLRAHAPKPNNRAYEVMCNAMIMVYQCSIGILTIPHAHSNDVAQAQCYRYMPMFLLLNLAGMCLLLGAGSALVCESALFV